jgi:hypothetical protein
VKRRQRRCADSTTARAAAIVPIMSGSSTIRSGSDGRPSLREHGHEDGRSTFHHVRGGRFAVRQSPRRAIRRCRALELLNSIPPRQ